MILIVFEDRIGDMLSDEKCKLIVSSLFIINLHNKSTFYHWPIEIEN